MIKAGLNKGASAVSKKLGKMPGIFESARSKAVQESILEIHREALKLIQDNSDGIPAIRYGPKRTVNVSRPGDPPNTDTGRLVKSVKFEFADDGAVGFVGSNYKVAAWLEFGTEDMAARPWLSTAVEKTAKKVDQIFSKWMRKAYEKAVGR